jgi:hypothetical protein
MQLRITRQGMSTVVSQIQRRNKSIITDNLNVNENIEESILECDTVDIKFINRLFEFIRNKIFN